MAAVTTALGVSAQLGRATGYNRPDDITLLLRQSMMALESLTMSAEDIRHLELRLFEGSLGMKRSVAGAHLPYPRTSPSFVPSLSKGLWILDT